jgi:hypothetical protein
MEAPTAIDALAETLIEMLCMEKKLFLNEGNNHMTFQLTNLLVEKIVLLEIMSNK